jgi:cytochrome bd ubiquinol oxidase subunit II
VVRLTASLTVVSLLWGWGAGQYPYLLPGTTVSASAATDSVLTATLISMAVGALLLVPSLWWLYRTFQQSGPAHGQTPPEQTTGPCGTASPQTPQ